MNRSVFLCWVAGLLLCAGLVVWWAEHDAAKATTDTIRVHDLGFFYKLDEKTRFLELKNQWQSRNRGELTLEKADEFAQEAYQNSDVEAALTRWRYHGGPSPFVLSGKIHLFNPGREAILNIPMQVSVRAKVAELRVNPAIQMTDFNHLERTARWENVSQNTVNVAAMAPGEDLRVEVMKFHMLAFLAKHPHRWPVEIEITVKSPYMNAVQKRIAVTPDHFMVPVLY